VAPQPSAPRSNARPAILGSKPHPKPRPGRPPRAKPRSSEVSAKNPELVRARDFCGSPAGCAANPCAPRRDAPAPHSATALTIRVDRHPGPHAAYPRPIADASPPVRALTCPSPNPAHSGVSIRPVVVPERESHQGRRVCLPSVHRVDPAADVRRRAENGSLHSTWTCQRRGPAMAREHLLPAGRVGLAPGEGGGWRQREPAIGSPH